MYILYNNSSNFKDKLIDNLYDCFVEKEEDESNHTNITDENRKFVENTGDEEAINLLRIGDMAKENGDKLSEANAHRKVQEWSHKVKNYKLTKEDKISYSINSKIIHECTSKDFKIFGYELK